MKKRSSGQQISDKTDLLFQSLTPDNINRIIVLNMPLVISIARGYARSLDKSGHTFEDIVQEGALGLHAAINKFEPSRGNKFATYASWWVRARIARFVATNSGVLGGRITNHDDHHQSIVRRAEEQARKSLEREPTSEEVFPLTQLTRNAFDSAQKIRNIRTVSLDEPNNDGVPWREAVTASEEVTPEDIALDEETQKTGRRLVQDMIDFLRSTESSRNAEIMIARFQLDGREEEPSLEDLAKVHGVTRERIRQLVFRSQRTLRQHFRGHREEVRLILNPIKKP